MVAGNTLTIPAPGAAPGAASAAASAPAAATAPRSGGGLRVRLGDTLGAIAARNGVSLSRLAAVNGLDPSRPLLAGTSLRLPGRGRRRHVGGPRDSTSAAPAPLGAYEVRPGDTLSALAARSRVPLQQMAFMNGLDPKKPLLAGTVIKLPTGSPVTSSAPAPAAHDRARRPARRGARPASALADRLDRRPARRAGVARDRDRVAGERLQQRDALGRERPRRHADPARHVGSGCRRTCRARASTRRSPADNVRAGSLYLADLMRQTNGDPAMAAAAYYQGLGVRAPHRHAAGDPALRRQRDGIAGRFGG